MSENASLNVVCLSKNRVDRSSGLPETGSGQDSHPSSETVVGLHGVQQKLLNEMKTPWTIQRNGPIKNEMEIDVDGPC